MLRVALVNMPFANLNRPSIALTQLKAAVDRQFAGNVTVDIFHLNYDFAELTGIELYQELANSSYAMNAGLCDWIFRQAAFSDLQDNSAAYYQRYFPRKDAQTLALRNTIEQIRPQLDIFVGRAIDRHGLDKY